MITDTDHDLQISEQKIDKISIYSWGVLAYTILVILWGAFVRATGSGAGCGNHWPSCNGVIIPRPERIETLIEFTHRTMTAILLPLFLVLLVWSFRRQAAGHRIRKAVVAAGILLVVESLIGAGLVRFDLVADNASVARALSIAFHLINTYFLLAALALTAWWSHGVSSVGTVWNARIRLLIVTTLLGMILLGATGAVTALGDTLFPAENLADGLRQDLSPTANFLIRLRIWHPVLAILVSGVTLVAVRRPEVFRSPDAPVRTLSRLTSSLIVIQLGIGIVNVLLLAPIWMQILHLLTADLIWIALVLLASEVLTSAQAEQSTPSRRFQKAALN